MGSQSVTTTKIQESTSTILNPENDSVQNYLAEIIKILNQTFKLLTQVNKNNKCSCQSTKQYLKQEKLLKRMQHNIIKSVQTTKKFNQLKQENQNLKLQLIAYDPKEKTKQSNSRPRSQSLAPQIIKTNKYNYQILQQPLKDYIKPLKFDLLTIFHSKKQECQINWKKYIGNSKKFIIISEVNKEQYIGCYIQMEDKQKQALTQIIDINLKTKPSVIAKKHSKLTRLQQGQFKLGKDQFVINKYGNVLKINFQQNSNQHQFKITKECKATKKVYPIRKIQVYRID